MYRATKPDLSEASHSLLMQGFRIWSTIETEKAKHYLQMNIIFLLIVNQHRAAGRSKTNNLSTNRHKRTNLRHNEIKKRDINLKVIKVNIRVLKKHKTAQLY
jgi:hypothetical protein